MLFGAVACKSKSNAPPPPAKEPATAKDQMHEIVKQPRTTTAGKTPLLEFTIDLPASASMPINGKEPAVTSWTFKDSKLSLEVSEVGGLPTQSLPKPKQTSEGTSTVKEEPGAYLVVEHRRASEAPASRLSIEYCRDLDPNEPPSGICCRLFSNYADYADDLVAFGDQVCRSIQVKNRKTIAPSGSATK